MSKDIVIDSFFLKTVTGLRPTALYALNVGQLKKENVHVVPCIMFYSVVGVINRNSKTSAGCWRAACEKPKFLLFPMRAFWVVL